jgi:hypothetical protein
LAHQQSDYVIYRLRNRECAVPVLYSVLQQRKTNLRIVVVCVIAFGGTGTSTGTGKAVFIVACCVYEYSQTHNFKWAYPGTCSHGYCKFKFEISLHLFQVSILQLVPAPIVPVLIGTAPDSLMIAHIQILSTNIRPKWTPPRSSEMADRWDCRERR